MTAGHTGGDRRVPDGAFVTTHETHSAVVFLVGDRAYKLKKPVDLGFLDFTTREARQAVCAREVALNSGSPPMPTSASPTSTAPTASRATTSW